MKMNEILNSRVVYYVGFALSYVVISKLIGFEDTVFVCMGVIIGEQTYLQYLNEKR